MVRVLSWAGVALVGDPVLILTPLFLFIALMIGAFALGAPASADALLSLVALPPVDAFQDVAVIELAGHGTIGTWLLRSSALVVRAATFGVLLHIAIQRARGSAPSLGEAVKFVRRRFGAVAFLELGSYALFGVTLSLNADLLATRDDGAIATALLFGVFLLIGPFIAVAAGELSAGAAFRKGLRWIRQHPLGHLGLVLLYGVASNGAFRLASSGEPGIQRALPVAVYGFLSALVTMWFVLAFARRGLSLEAEEARPQASDTAAR